MAWTGFVVEMLDGRLFSFGTTFLAEFFSLPDGYEFTDVRTVHNHSYARPDGTLASLGRGLSSQPDDYDPSTVYRERPYFTCNFDA